MRARTWPAILVALLALPSCALGHARVVSASVDATGTALLAFSAPVEDAFLEVRAADGTRLDPVASRPDPNLVELPRSPAGESISVRVLSRDGHVTRQRLALPARAAPPQPVEGGAGRDGTISIAGDMLAFAGLLGLLGLVGVRFAVVDAAVRSAPRPPGHGDDERWRAAAEAALGGSRASWRTAVWVAGGLAGAGLLMSGGGIVRELGEGLGGTGPLLGETRWGRAWLVQAAGLCVALAAAGLRRRSAAGRVAELGGARAALIGGPAAAALVAISWSGHATSGTDAVLGGALDALHLLASALWIGGLIALIVSVPTARRRLAPQDATRLTAGIVVRFSALAIACVGVIVVTGVYRGLAELRSLGDLLDTGYGQALLVKLGLFAVLMTGGAYNRLVLHPRLERAALGLAEGDRGAGSRLASSVRAELILATGVIAAAAVLVALPPP